MKPNLDKPYIFHRSNRAYLYIVLYALFIIGLIVVVSNLFYETYLENSPVSGDFFEKWLGMLIMFAFVVFLMVGFYTKWLLAFLKATQPIVFNLDSISFGPDNILHSEIVAIKPFDIGYISYERYYGALVDLTNGNNKFIAEKFFKNASLIFERLDKINRSQHPKIEPDVQLSNLEPEKEERFNYNILLSFDNIAMSSLLLTTLYGVWKSLSLDENPVALSYFFLVISMIVYYLCTQVSYYYVIDNHNFEIKNKFLPGFSKVYRIDEIQAAVIHIEGAGRAVRYGIRIVRKDYTSCFFGTNAFSKKKWKSMEIALEKRGVFVVNRLQNE